MPASPKALAHHLFLEVVRRVDVLQSARRAIVVSGRELHVGTHSFDLHLFRRVLLVSIGKAAVPMAQHIVEILEGVLPLQGLVIGVGAWTAPAGIRYMQGEHPVPYQVSFQAAQASLDLVREADPETLILYLISGGASAMAEAPVDPSISMPDLSRFYEQILYSGLRIEQANVLRKHFSAIKGGRLALAAGPATHCTVLIADVPVGRLDVVGSGPSLPDSSSVTECRRLLSETLAFANAPASILSFAQRLPETPKHLPHGVLPSVCLALLSSDSLIEAAEPILSAAGYRVVIDNTCDDWDYLDAARHLVQRASAEAEAGLPVCILSAGEVTVSIRTRPGVGGRNQQWALAVAQLIDGKPGYTAMSAGSDGIDGNSPAAGAIVDSTTWQRARSLGFDPAELLENFNAHPLFAALGDAITPGPLGNNIRDLRLILVNAAP